MWHKTPLLKRGLHSYSANNANNINNTTNNGLKSSGVNICFISTTVCVMDEAKHLSGKAGVWSGIFGSCKGAAPSVPGHGKPHTVCKYPVRSLNAVSHGASPPFQTQIPSRASQPITFWCLFLAYRTETTMFAQRKEINLESAVLQMTARKWFC